MSGDLSVAGGPTKTAKCPPCSARPKTGTEMTPILSYPKLTPTGEMVPVHRPGQPEIDGLAAECEALPMTRYIVLPTVIVFALGPGAGWARP